MLREIVLHGALAEQFGGPFHLAVDTPAEVIRALLAQVKGFRARLVEGHYRLIRGHFGSGQELGIEAVHMRLGTAAEFHIMPVIAGSASGLGKLIAGLVLVAVAVAAPYLLPETFGATGSLLATGAVKVTFAIGAALALGGIGMMLAKAPPTPGADNSSFLFGGQDNVTVQGGPVPLVYGQTITGVVVISAGLETQQLLGGGTDGNAVTILAMALNAFFLHNIQTKGH